MTLGKIFGILIFSSLIATGATLAGDISKNLANSKQMANAKGDKVPPKGAAASVVVHHVWREAPIVVGRSVSLRHTYDKTRIAKVSGAIQAALVNILRVPEDFYQLIFEFPKERFLHTASFVGMHYTDDLIILDLTFIQGRSKETRLALLKDINARVATAAGVLPDDLIITLYEAPGENFSFGQGEAQRANAVLS